MSKVIQIRRGTTAEHQSFVGKIGEVTMNTDAKTLHVHDDQTVGGTPLAKVSDLEKFEQYSTAINNLLDQLNAMEHVVETQNNGSSWYRKYRSGWIEQGGYTEAANDSAITFAVPMANNLYHASCCIADVIPLSNAPNGVLQLHTMTATGMRLYRGGSQTRRIHWQIKGYAMA